MKKNFKQLAILFLLFGLVDEVISQSYDNISAQIIVELDTLKQIKNNVIHRDTCFHPQVSNEIGSRVGTITGEVALVIGFIQQPMVGMEYPHVYHNTKVSMKVVYIKSGGTKDSTRIHLSLDYNQSKGTNYKVKDFFKIDSVIWAEVAIDTFQTDNSFALGSKQVSVFYQILGKYNTPINFDATPEISLKKTANNGYVRVDVNPVDWASSYDLEWRFVDAYSEEALTLDKKATRINVTKHQYDIPIITSRAKLIARVRGRAQRPGQSDYVGLWSNIGTPIDIGGDYAFEKDKKPWQYQATYAENGFRSDVVSFFDGTGRSRQTLTKSNSMGQHLVAMETYYDSLGRPAINVLPTPFKPDIIDNSIATGSTPSKKYQRSTLQDVLRDIRRGGLPKNVAQGANVGSANNNLTRETYTYTRPDGTQVITNAVTNRTANSAVPAIPPRFLPNIGNGLPPLNIPSIGPGFVPWNPRLPNGIYTPLEKPITIPDVVWGGKRTPQPIDFSDLERYTSDIPPLYYIPLLNTNEEGKQYSAADFDRQMTSCDTGLKAKPMSTSSGTGKYYSPNNDVVQTHQGEIPDAEGYPFTQIEYTPDNTGRVNRQGMAGKTMQIGGGHDVTSYYAVPTQGELNRLFGNEVGDASNYMKVLTKNQDKQLIVKYLNSKGQTIASGLAGTPPLTLENLQDKEAPMSSIVNIPNTINDMDYKNGMYSIETSTLVETDRSEMRVNFRLTPQQMQATICNQNICYDCPKSALIQVIDDCGNMKLEKRFSIRHESEDPNINTCDNLQGISFDILLTGLKMGTYTIKKYIVLDQEARDAYINDYISRDTACFVPNISPPLPCPPPPPCVPCEYVFKNNMNPLYLYEVPFPGKPQVDLGKYRIGRTKYIPCSDACHDSNPAWDIEKFIRMKQDVQPGGRYGCYEGCRSADTFSLYLENIMHATPIYKTLAPGTYINTDGTESWIDVSVLPWVYGATDVEEDDPSRFKNIDGRLHTIPQQIIDLEFLKSIWQDTWSDLLVAYHPEYQKFYFDHVTAELGSDNPTTISAVNVAFDRKMNHSNTTFEDAVDMGIFSTNANIEACVANDPFFNNAEGLRVRENFINKLKNYHFAGNGQYLDIYSLVIAQVFCNGPYYNQAFDITDPRSNDYYQCAQENKAAKLASLTTDQKYYIWQAYKTYYQTAKQLLIDSLRQSALRAGARNSFDLARSVGSNTIPSGCSTCNFRNDYLNNKLGKMDPIYPHLYCLFSCLRTGNTMLLPYGNTHTTQDTILMLNELKIARKCGKTLNSITLLTFFNTLAQHSGGSLFNRSNVDLNDVPPIVMPNNLISYFPNRYGTNYYWSAIQSDSDPNSLQVNITDQQGVIQSSLKFSKTNRLESWSDISVFACIDTLRTVKPHYNKYFIKVFKSDGLKDTIYLDLDEHLNPAIKFYKARRAELQRILVTNGRFTLDTLPTNCCMEFMTERRVIEPSCDQANQEIYAAAIQAAKLTRAMHLRDSIGMVYNRRCMVGDQLTASVNISSYYFTLFYYDQAGNLTMTIPPKGVRADGYGNHDLSLATRYTYNTNGKLLTTTSPDGGLTRMIYDQVGRPILSQDAVQNSARTPSVNYMFYDEYSRIIESGEAAFQQGARSFETAFNNGYTNYESYKNFQNSRFLPPNLGGNTIGWKKNDHTTFTYDTFSTDAPPAAKFKNKKQEYLRNRVSNIKSYNENGSQLEHAMYFSYDVTGNAKEIIQDIAALQQINPRIADQHRYKSIRYLYDQLSGKVNQISYQEDQPDQFYRWYTYDADMRVVSVKTGFSKWEPEIYKDIDARYDYYKHGPISRMALGSENVQSVDMAYNINGMLKNVNNGITENHGTSLPDALSYSLHYHNGDYKKIHASNPIPVTTSSGMPDLYSGNISAVSMQNVGLGDQTVQSHTYKYDQLHRLISSRVNGTNAYQMDLTYDKNGNITSLKRANKVGTLFDDLTYQYNIIKKNQLASISDGNRNVALMAGDLETQTANNYAYDAKGRLTSDNAEDMKLTWSPTDKLRRVEGNRRNTNHFYYDVYGRRSIKTEVTTDLRLNTELTILDMAGNVLSEYKIKGDSVVLSSIPIYTASRIGSIEPQKLIKANDTTYGWSQYRGQKLYELKNQIGDINALVSDRRLSDDLGNVSYDIRKATEYYPFGMVMPGRDSSAIAYKYGFQGMEQDDNLKGAGNSISTEFRQYDPRVGRWLSVDPLSGKTPFQSPYQITNNNPISGIDPKGLSRVKILGEKTKNGRDVYITLRDGHRGVITATRSEADQLRSLLSIGKGNVTIANNDGYMTPENARVEYERRITAFKERTTQLEDVQEAPTVQTQGQPTVAASAPEGQQITSSPHQRQRTNLGDALAEVDDNIGKLARLLNDLKLSSDLLTESERTGLIKYGKFLNALEMTADAAKLWNAYQRGGDLAFREAAAIYLTQKIVDAGASVAGNGICGPACGALVQFAMSNIIQDAADLTRNLATPGSLESLQLQVRRDLERYLNPSGRDRTFLDPRLD